MRTQNYLLTKQAREALSGKWGLAIGTIVVFQLVLIGAQMVPFAALIIMGPMSVGMSIFVLNLIRRREAQLSMIFSGFDCFGTALGAFFLKVIFIFLWALLLIIPGIIAAYAYSQTFFIIADQPNIDALEAIKKSKEMMVGNKWKLFCLGLRFFGWALLCLLFTFGIGFLWLFPYIQVSYAAFYEDLKKQSASDFSQELHQPASV